MENKWSLDKVGINTGKPKEGKINSLYGVSHTYILHNKYFFRLLMGKSHPG